MGISDQIETLTNSALQAEKNGDMERATMFALLAHSQALERFRTDSAKKLLNSLNSLAGSLDDLPGVIRRLNRS
ncbi:hypothetical protein GCM10027294_43610 [Marinactinospora endophytica]